MLGAMRKASKTWASKILLLLLVAAFGLWGITDYIRPSSQENTITVGGQSYADSLIRDRFNRAYSAQRQQGDDRSVEDVVRDGLMDQVVDAMVTEALFQIGAPQMGIVVADETLRREIQTNPVFFGSDGRFDRARFNQLLTGEGLTEKGYVSLLRAELARVYMISPIAPGVNLPQTVSDTFGLYATERRDGEVLFIDAAKMPAPIAPPDETLLEAIYTDNIARFTDPERREGTLLLLAYDDMLDDVEVTDAEIQEHYETYADNYHDPDRRTVLQATLKTAEAAEAVMEAVNNGTSLEAAAKANGGTFVNMGEVTRDKLPPEFATVVFGAPVGNLAEPYQSSFGWHLFLVTEERDGIVHAMDMILDEIRNELALSKVHDVAYERAIALEDAISTGATLEEAAAALDITPRTINVDRRGLTIDGQPVEGLPADAKIAEALFRLQDGQNGSLTEFPGGYFVLRADRVQPATPRPFEEVRDDVLALWTQSERSRAASFLAASLLERAKDGESLSALAASNPAASYQKLTTVPRYPLPEETNNFAGTYPVILNALFGGETGSFQVVSAPTGAGLVRVGAISHPDNELAKTERNMATQFILNSFRDDVTISFANSLRQSIGVSVNRERARNLVLPTY